MIVRLGAIMGVYFIGFYLIFNYQMTANLAHGIRTGYIVLGIHDFGDTEAKKVARRVLVLDRQMPAGTKCLKMLWCYVRSWRSGSRGPSKVVERLIAGEMDLRPVRPTLTPMVPSYQLRSTQLSGSFSGWHSGRVWSAEVLLRNADDLEVVALKRYGQKTGYRTFPRLPERVAETGYRMTSRRFEYGSFVA